MDLRATSCLAGIGSFGFSYPSTTLRSCRCRCPRRPQRCVQRCRFALLPGPEEAGCKVCTYGHVRKLGPAVFSSAQHEAGCSMWKLKGASFAHLLSVESFSDVSRFERGVQNLFMLRVRSNHQGELSGFPKQRTTRVK